MMARQHCLSGVLAGIGVAAVLPTAPLPVRVLAIAVTGGAALLPDLDHRAATAARSLGLLTRLVAVGISRISLAIYYATREGGDPADRRSGHRLFTHTIPGCVVAASLVAVACLLHPAVGGAVVALLVGLLGLGLKMAGTVPGLVAGGATWWALTDDFGWWWVFPVATFLGCLVHIVGDTVTDAGTPLWWPIMRGGRRWQPVTTPVTFAAGDHVERAVVAPLLAVGVAVAASGALGVWPLVFAALGSAGA
jgi:membrane-bound metal-dependent hydrolase YbcI (DUF457 family)